MNFKDRALAVKNHVVEHKTVYIATAGGIMVGVVVTVVCTRKGGLKQTIDSFKWKSPTHNHVETVIQITPRGNLGKIIHNVTTDDWYTSQNEAAEKLGVSIHTIRQHLNGQRDHIKNQVLASPGKNHGQQIKLVA